MDPQANLSLSFLDIEEWKSVERQGRTIKHWYDHYLDHHQDLSLRDFIVSPSRINKKVKGRLDLISSHLELVEVDMELSSKLGGHTDRAIRNNYLTVLSRLRTKLNEIKTDYDVVFIDCPPNFNLITQNALCASDYYIIPAKPDYLSTLGINTFIKHVKALSEKFNGHARAVRRQDILPIFPKNLGIVFTMVNYRGGRPISAQREYITQLMRSSNPYFLHYLCENKTIFASAPETGIPVVLSKLSRQQENIKIEIQALVDEVLASLKKGRKVKVWQ